MSEQKIRHRQGDGTFKAHPGSTPGEAVGPAEIAAIRLSVSDADVQAALDRVGAQRLCLTQAGEDKFHVRIGYSLPGRNPYAVRFAAWDCQNFWPGVKSFELVIVPDVMSDAAGIPPEFVRMLEPRLLLAFEVLAW